MNFSKIDVTLLSKFTEFLNSLGFFGEIIVLCIVSFVLYSNIAGLLVFYIGLVANSFLNQLLKTTIKNPRPTGPIKFLADETVMKGSNSYGLPSGHSQNVFYSITYLYLTVQQWNLWTILSCVIGFMTIYERWTHRNHTFTQLLCGAAVGCLFAFFVIYMRGQLEKNMRKL
jgi:membrane-associated phospholipid phosphatase